MVSFPVFDYDFSRGSCVSHDFPNTLIFFFGVLNSMQLSSNRKYAPCDSLIILTKSNQFRFVSSKDNPVTSGTKTDLILTSSTLILFDCVVVE